MPEPASPRWNAVVAYALTGEVFDLPEPGEPRPADVVVALASLGWGADAILAEARRCIQSDRPWPHPIGPSMHPELGRAQLQAAVTAARGLLGLQTLVTRPPSARTELTADEVRLLRDVPPHHGA